MALQVSMCNDDCKNFSLFTKRNYILVNTNIIIIIIIKEVFGPGGVVSIGGIYLGEAK